MPNYINFHEQLVSVMDKLTQIAVAEIIKLVDESCSVLRLEMHHGKEENERLRRKLRSVESELRTAQRAGSRESYTNHIPFGDGVYDGLLGTETDSVAETGAATGRGPLVEFHRIEVVCDRQTPPGENSSGEELDTHPASVEGLEGFTEQHWSGRVQETHGGLELMVKAEEEEKLGAPGPDQSGSYHSTGTPNSLGSDFVTREMTSELWTQGDSDVDSDYPDCSYSTGRHSQIHPVNTEPQPATAIGQDSCDTPLSPRKPFVRVVKAVPVKEEVEGQSACKSNSHAIHTRQEQYGGLDSVQRGDLMLQPKLQLHKLSENQTEVSQSLAAPNMDSTDGYSLSDDNFNTATKTTHRAASGKNWFICAHCGKSFAYLSCYKVHLRSHTGEKPYSCVECGKSFTQQSNLTKHESVHSGKKPFSCSQCGKSFRHRYNLTLHQRIHSGEKPYHCLQCGRSFAQSCHFKRHQRCHGEKPRNYVD